MATGLTLTAKHSGVLIFPTLFLLAAMAFFAAPEPSAPPPNRRLLRLRDLAVALVFIALVSVTVLWAVYGFRFAARPGDLQLMPSLAGYAAGMSHPLQRSVILFSARHHLLPEAYLYGLTDILLIPGQRRVFILGHLFPVGQWFFFPSVFLIKSTLALLVLLLLVPFARLRERRRELLFLVLPAAFFLATAIASMINLGVRHLLPIYPFCIVLAGAAAASLATRSVVARVAIAALLLFTAISSLHAFPNYLAYSNEAAGGPSNTYRLVSGDNDDWGQGLKWAKTYLDQHPASDCWIAYSNSTVDPAKFGIDCHRLLSGFGHRAGIGTRSIPFTITGTVLLSTNEFSGVPWGPGSLNPYEVFHNRQPEAIIGNIILVYRGSFEVPLLAAQTDAVAAKDMLQQHRFPEALELAQHAAQLAPDSAEIEHVFGLTLEAAGRSTEAQQVNAKARHLAETIYPEYQKALAK